MKAPENTSVQEVIKRMDEQYQKYKFMEANLLYKKRRCIAGLCVCVHVCVCVCACVRVCVCLSSTEVAVHNCLIPCFADSLCAILLCVSFPF